MVRPTAIEEHLSAVGSKVGRCRPRRLDQQERRRLPLSLLVLPFPSVSSTLYAVAGRSFSSYVFLDPYWSRKLHKQIFKPTASSCSCFGSGNTCRVSHCVKNKQKKINFCGGGPVLLRSIFVLSRFLSLNDPLRLHLIDLNYRLVWTKLYSRGK